MTIEQINAIRMAGDKIAIAMTKDLSQQQVFLKDPLSFIRSAAPELLQGMDDAQCATLAGRLQTDKCLTENPLSLESLAHKMRCWSCRIGLNAIFAGALAAAVAAAVASGGTTAPIIAALVSWGLSEAAAASVVASALAAGGTSTVGVVEALIELACQAIPHTCEK